MWHDAGWLFASPTASPPTREHDDPPHIVRDIVGHADTGVTMKIYAHASLAEKRAALAQLDARLR